jgi:hypothetical protein
MLHVLIGKRDHLEDLVWYLLRSSLDNGLPLHNPVREGLPTIRELEIPNPRMASFSSSDQFDEERIPGRANTREDAGRFVAPESPSVAPQNHPDWGNGTAFAKVESCFISARTLNVTRAAVVSCNRIYDRLVQAPTRGITPTTVTSADASLRNLFARLSTCICCTVLIPRLSMIGSRLRTVSTQKS